MPSRPLQQGFLHVPFRDLETEMKGKEKGCEKDERTLKSLLNQYKRSENAILSRISRISRILFRIHPDIHCFLIISTKVATFMETSRKFRLLKGRSSDSRDSTQGLDLPPACLLIFWPSEGLDRASEPQEAENGRPTQLVGGRAWGSKEGLG